MAATATRSQAATLVARTVILQPDRLCREGLCRLLEDCERIRLLPAASSAWDALESARNHHPDLFIIEVDLPNCDGLELLSELVHQPNEPKVLVLSHRGGHAYITACLTRGARGYLVRNASPEELKEAIRRVLAGEVYVQPALAAGLISRRLGPQRHTELTDRECAILIHLSRGATNQEIARTLYLGEKTVRNSLTRLFDKLGARNRTEAVSLGREQGYL